MNKISCVIPARHKLDYTVQRLVKSIKAQDYPKRLIEIIVVTDGDSEEAKAIGIRKAKGVIIGMFCDDNVILDPMLFRKVSELHDLFPEVTGIYSKYYAHVPEDNSLNRYFSLIGCNDPLAFYLDKADRRPHWEMDGDKILEIKTFEHKVPSLGCNGFFYKADHIRQADLDHYYPMDCAEDLRRKGLKTYAVLCYPDSIHHKTADGFIDFLTKRYKYARDLYSDRSDRRWKMLGEKRDLDRLSLFILCAATIIEPIIVGIKGFRRVKDPAWFWHPVVCLGFLFIYGALACRNLVVHQSLFQRQDQKRCTTV